MQRQRLDGSRLNRGIRTHPSSHEPSCPRSGRAPRLSVWPNAVARALRKATTAIFVRVWWQFHDRRPSFETSTCPLVSPAQTKSWSGLSPLCPIMSIMNVIFVTFAKKYFSQVTACFLRQSAAFERSSLSAPLMSGTFVNRFQAKTGAVTPAGMLHSRHGSRQPKALSRS